MVVCTCMAVGHGHDGSWTKGSKREQGRREKASQKRVYETGKGKTCFWEETSNAGGETRAAVVGSGPLYLVGPPPV
jgi:hypothetical protein